MNNKLYVGNLSWNTTNDTLAQAFAKAGNVKSAQVVIDNMTGKSRGFGFVEMESEAEAQTAIEMFNGKDLDGREIIVNVAKPREDTPRTGGFGGSRGGSRGGFGGGSRDNNRSGGGFRRNSY